MAIVTIDGDSTCVELPAAVPKEMISVGNENGKCLVRINSSSLGIIQECLRKAQYSLVEGWRADVQSPATLFGSAIHRALEIFYKGQPEERILPKYEHLEMMAYGHIPPPTNNDLIYRAVAGFLDVAKPLSGLPETDKRSLQNGVWILNEYFKTYIDDPYVAYVDQNGPFIERTFTHRFHEDQTLIVDIFGTIDFVFKNLRSGGLLAGDHKTASFLNFGGSSYFDREKPNHQYTMYLLGVNKVFGLSCEDFMVNVVEVKAKPKTKGAKGVSFPRQITKRTEEDFDELREVIMDAVHRYLYAKDMRVYPMGGVDACNRYGSCQFKQVCASPKSMRETILNNKFKRDSGGK
jgi:hypothetical protein